MCQYGYITPTFLRSYGGEKSTQEGVDVVEMSTKCVKRGGKG